MSGLKLIRKKSGLYKFTKDMQKRDKNAEKAGKKAAKEREKRRGR